MLRLFASRHVALVALKKPFKISGATFFVAVLRFMLRLSPENRVALHKNAYKLHIN